MPEIMNMTPLFPGHPNTPPPSDFWLDLRARALEMDNRPAFTIRQVLSRPALLAGWCMAELKGCAGLSRAFGAVFEFAHMTEVATSAAGCLLARGIDLPSPILDVRFDRDDGYPLLDHHCIWDALATESLSAGDTPWPREGMKVRAARVVSQRFLYRAGRRETPCEQVLAMTAFADLAGQAFALEALLDLEAPDE